MLISSDDDFKKFELSENEWRVISQISVILQCFNRVSDVLCGGKYVILPSIVVEFHMMLDKMEATVEVIDKKPDRNSLDEVIIFAIQTECEKMLKHYRKFNWIYCVALILDPRFRLEGFKKFKKIYSSY